MNLCCRGFRYPSSWVTDRESCSGRKIIFSSWEILSSSASGIILIFCELLGVLVSLDSTLKLVPVYEEFCVPTKWFVSSAIWTYATVVFGTRVVEWPTEKIVQAEKWSFHREIFYLPQRTGLYWFFLANYWLCWLAWTVRLKLVPMYEEFCVSTK